MSIVKVDVRQFLEMPNVMRKLQGRTDMTMEKAVASIANRIRTTAIDLIHKGPKTGIMYGDHQASAPGEAPATDTGDLARSVKIRRDSDGKTWYVVAGAAYASYLEFGTELMEPRPFMTPAFVEALPNLKDEIWKAWKDHKQSLSKGE